ncbi:MAG: iron-containing redox enzyme family protein [Halioglobus sp.]
MSLSNSEIIRSKIQLFDQQLGLASYEFWNHPEFARIYCEYIYQSHSIIRASVPLMQAAEQACALPQHKKDPALPDFASYLHKHIPEETGHDDWILDDGEAMGLKRESILKRVPSAEATHLVGAQYYWIWHYNPIALIGHIATLEGNPPTLELIDEVAKKHNLPLECFTTFRYHAQIDPQHRRDLDEVLDALPLTKEHIALIGVSAMRTIGLMTRVMREIVQSGE